MSDQRLFEEHAQLWTQGRYDQSPAADKLAHTDGYLTFISPNQALVSTFPEAWARKYPEDQQCVDTLTQQLRELGIGVVHIQVGWSSWAGHNWDVVLSWVSK